MFLEVLYFLFVFLIFVFDQLNFSDRLKSKRKLWSLPCCCCQGSPYDGDRYCEFAAKVTLIQSIKCLVTSITGRLEMLESTWCRQNWCTFVIFVDWRSFSLFCFFFFFFFFFLVTLLNEIRPVDWKTRQLRIDRCGLIPSYWTRILYLVGQN